MSRSLDLSLWQTYETLPCSTQASRPRCAAEETVAQFLENVFDLNCDLAGVLLCFSAVQDVFVVTKRALDPHVSKSSILKGLS